MTYRDRLHAWWKRFPKSLRRGLSFLLGLFFILLSPLIGTVPGPGGIAVFLLGIAVLASEFDWAESLKSFFLETVPKEVERRWQPTIRWQRLFDATALVLLIGAAISVYYHIWQPVISLGIGGVSIFVFNRNRLERLKKKLRKLRKK